MVGLFWEVSLPENVQHVDVNHADSLGPVLP